jgi:hypothetical protein
VLSDVSTLCFETNAGRGFREPAFSKERRPDPQTTLGLSAGARRVRRGRLEACEGNKAETPWMLPVVSAFESVHNLCDVMGGR